MFEIAKIQEYLKAEKLDGWLLVDFHARNHVAIEFLSLSPKLTRRTAYFIPADGEPVAIIHNIEKEKFRHLPGKRLLFSAYRLFEDYLYATLKGYSRIAVEYSRGGRLPYIGLVEAGTIEMIRSFGVEIVSSADIVSFFQARMSAEQVAFHKKAAVLVNKIKDEAFAQIRSHLAGGVYINEKMVVDFIMRRFSEEKMVTDFPPSVAVDANISNPHYEPSADNSTAITPGRLVLIDLWAKLNVPHAVFADITWMGFAGTTVPEKYGEVFATVIEGRDRAVGYLKERLPRQEAFGYDVDDACRKVIADAGYGDYFFHRTGHSILDTVHGPGPNIDNLETEDRRRLMPGHLFSIEPGIYLPEYGFRSEINVMITEDGPEITTVPVQKEIIPLLA